MARLNPALPNIGTDARGAGESTLRDDIVAILAELNGNLDQTNMAPAFANGVVEPAFTAWKEVVSGGVTLVGSLPAATYQMTGGSNPNSSFQTAGAALSAANAFYLEPTHYTAGVRATKLRIVFGGVANGVASGSANQTVGLYPVATWGGASGAAPTIASLGAVVSSVGPLVFSPASTPLITASAEFNFPASGWYCFAVASGGTAAGSLITINTRLQLRQV